MDVWHEFLRLFTELDHVLFDLVRSYGAWTYGILAAIVFAETGLVVAPFLPGDSLLFAAGALCGVSDLNVVVLASLLFCAAVGGDLVNYHVGKAIGPRAFSGRFRLLKHEHLERTQTFFEKYGGKAIMLARFVPIVRTFMPFVAGVGAMRFRRFITFSVLGGALWVGLFVGAGYLFGNLPIVKHNFSKVILLIIAVSLLPIAIEWWRARSAAGAARRASAGETH
ncbi:MAG: VTT domain-containing protein [Phycisphaerae bacterium]|nr:VTT domain-containing protein [Phycisphaerae bacterium]